MINNFNCPDFPLNSKKTLGQLLAPLKIDTFHKALNWVFSLPYKRISNLNDISLIAKEKRGTCTSKHGFLAALAHENNHPEIKLEVGYFKFSKENLPEFKPKFEEIGTDYILEAHGYLKCGGNTIDVTSDQFDPDEFLNMNSPVETESLSPEQAGDVKQKKHLQKYQKWCEENGLDFDQAWKLRWDIIKYLVDTSSK